MVGNLVSNSLRVDTPASAIPPDGLAYMCLTLDWSLIIIKLTVLVMRADGAGCGFRGFGGLLLLLFLVEEGNNVGNVAQSEKSKENFQQIVFREGYTAYIGYISGLDRVGYHVIEDR